MIPLLPMSFAAMTGAAVGSWAATALVRRRRGDHAWSGRSHCDHCSLPLSYAATLPLISFIASRGRCRRCGGPIAAVHPACELLGALAGAGLVALLHG